MCPQQYRGLVFQCFRQRFTPFDSADETRFGIDRRAFGWEKSRVHMDGTKTALQYAEKRAPLRVGVTDGHYVRASAHDTGVNVPFVGRWLFAVQIVAVEVEQNQPIQRRTAGAYAGQREKSFGSGNTKAYVAVAVGDPFPIENMTAVNQLRLKFFKFARIERGNV